MDFYGCSSMCGRSALISSSCFLKAAWEINPKHTNCINSTPRVTLKWKRQSPQNGNDNHLKMDMTMTITRKRIALRLFFDISNQPLFNDSFEKSKAQNIPNAMAFLEFPGSLTSACASGGARGRIPLIVFCDISNRHLLNESFEQSKSRISRTQ